MSFPTLPVIEQLMRTSSPDIEARLSRTTLVAVQHLLESTGSLIDALLRLGLSANNVFVLGKAYSSNPNVAAELRARGVSVDPGCMGTTPGGFQEVFRGDVVRLWERVTERMSANEPGDVIVLDDGGRCTSMIPAEVLARTKVSGVEQTTSGVVSQDSPPSFPIVQVATSAAKRILESPMISRAVLRRLPALEPGSRCGVIGVGSVGSAVVSRLLECRCEVAVFDRDPARLQACSIARIATSLEQLLFDAEFVFGCTGEDVFASALDPRWHPGETTLISCSSEDREFKSLLAGTLSRSAFDSRSSSGDYVFQDGSARVRILHGGFPINFDRTPTSVPSNEIQLTRALLIGGVVQALLIPNRGPAIGSAGRMLDPRLQATIAATWFGVEPQHQTDFSSETLAGMTSEPWIAARSGGVLEDNSDLHATLGLSGATPNGQP